MSIRLFDLNYLPLTSEAGFLQADLGAVVLAYDNWLVRCESTKSSQRLSGHLNVCLQRLLPMTWASTRVLLWATRAGWTLLLDNSGGGMISTATPYLSQEVLRCRGMRVAWQPRIPFKDKRGAHGGTILDVFGPDGTRGTVRSISKVYESGWEFDTFGAPLPFERYSDSELRKRWSKDLLIEYARELGVELEDPGFFGTAGVLYEEHADWVKNCRVQTLKQAQHGMRLFEVPPGDLC